MCVTLFDEKAFFYTTDFILGLFVKITDTCLLYLSEKDSVTQTSFGHGAYIRRRKTVFADPSKVFLRHRRSTFWPFAVGQYIS